MATTSDRLRKQAKKVKKDVHGMADIARNGARKNVRQLRASASRGIGQGRAKARQVERGVVQYIRDRPIKSASVAAGFGLVCGGVWIYRLMTALARAKSDA